MPIRRYELTLKNRAAIALAIVALIVAGTLLLSIGMALIVAVLGVGVIAAGGFAIRNSVRRALGKAPPREVRRSLDPSREVFAEPPRERAPRLRGRSE